MVQAHDSLYLFNLAGGVTAAGNVGIGAAVGLEQVQRDTEAYIGDAAGAAGSGEDASLHSAGNVIVDAKNGGILGTLALAAAKVAPDSDSSSNSSDYGVGVSGDVSLNYLTDTAQAYLHDAAVFAAALSVNATNHTDLAAISGSVAIVLTTGTSVGIAGSFTQNTVGGGSSAFLDNADLTLTGPLLVDAAATEQFYSITASGSFVPSGSGIAIAGQVSLNSIGTTTLAETLDGSTIAAGSSNVTMTATNHNGIFAVAGALAYGGEAGIGAALATNGIDDTAGAYFDASSVTSAGAVALSAVNAGTIFSITVGGAGPRPSPLAGPSSLNHVTDMKDAHLSHGTQITASGTVSLSVTDSPTIEALAGGLAGAGTAAIGAALATNNIDDDTQAYLDGSGVTAGAFTLSATSNASIESLTVAGAGSGTFAAGGAVGLNSINDSTEVYLTDGSERGRDRRVNHDRPGRSLDHGRRRRSRRRRHRGDFRRRRHQQHRRHRHRVHRRRPGRGPVGEHRAATENANIEAASIGVSASGTVAVTGGVGVNEIHNTTDVHIAGAASVTSTGGDIALTAQDTSDNSSLTGQAAGSLVGIGGAVSYNVIGDHVRAYIDSSTVISNAGSVLVESLLTATINTLTAGLSGGFVGIGGSVAVNLLQSDVDAHVANSLVNAYANVVVSANVVDQLQVIAGAVSGGVVAAAGTVVVNNMNNSARAYLEDASVAAAGHGNAVAVPSWNASTGAESTQNIHGLAVIANTNEQPNPNGDGHSLEAVNVSGGLVGIGGVVSVTSINDVTQAFIASSQINSSAHFGGSVIVSRNSDDHLFVLSGGLAGGFVGASSHRRSHQRHQPDERLHLQQRRERQLCVPDHPVRRLRPERRGQHRHR